MTELVTILSPEEKIRRAREEMILRATRNRMLASQQGAPTPPPPSVATAPPPTPTPAPQQQQQQQAPGVIVQLPIGVAEGISDVTGLPADLIGNLMSSAARTGVNPSVPGTSGPRRKVTLGEIFGDVSSARDFLLSMFTKLGIPDVEATTVAERIARRGAQEIGAAIAPFNRGPGRAGLIARSPAAGVAAGAAAEAAPAIAKGFGASQETQDIASLAADLIASVATDFGLSGAGRGIERGARKVSDFGRGAERKGRVEAGETLQRAIGDPETPAKLEAAKGKDLTAGQASAEPAITALETQMAATSPEFNRTLRTKVAEQSAANRALLDEVAPSGDSDAIAASINERVTRVRDATENRIAQGQTEINRQLAQGGDPQAANEAHNTFLREQRRDFKNKQSNLFNAVDPSNEGRFDAMPLIQAAKKEGQAKAGRLPRDVPRNVINLIEKLVVPTIRQTETKAGTRFSASINVPGQKPVKKTGFKTRAQAMKWVEENFGPVAEQVPFEHLRELRSTVLNEIRRENATGAPNRKKLKSLGDILEGANKSLDGIADDAAFPDIAERYATARAYTAKNAPIYNEGPIFRVTREGKPIPISETTNEFIRGRGRKEKTDLLISQLQRDPAQMKLFEDAMITDLTSTTVNGVINPTKLRLWRKNNKHIIDRLPRLRDILNDIEKTQARVDQLGLRLNRIQGAADQRTAALFLNGDPAKAVNDVLNSPNPGKAAKRVKVLVGRDPQALAGLRRVLWNDLEVRGAGRGVEVGAQRFDTLSSDGLRNALDDNEAVFREWGFNDTDIAAVRKVIEDTRTTERIRIPSGAGGEPPLPHVSLKQRITTIFSRAFNVQRGAVGAPFVITEGVTREVVTQLENMTNAHSRRLLKEALLDADFASNIIKASRINFSPDEQGTALRNILNKMILAGVIQESEQGDSAPRAAARGANALPEVLF